MEDPKNWLLGPKQGYLPPLTPASIRRIRTFFNSLSGTKESGKMF